MSDNVAKVIADMTYLLLQLFEDGVVDAGGRFRRRSAEHVIDHAEVDDWIVALGHARFPFVRRKALRDGEVGLWISHMQATVLIAMNPKLAGL